MEILSNTIKDFKLFKCIVHLLNLYFSLKMLLLLKVFYKNIVKQILKVYLIIFIFEVLLMKIFFY